jgi:hypothetical protein
MLMTQLLFKNNINTTLNAPLTNIAVTATLAPGSGAALPAPGAGQGFKATFVDAATGAINEIVLVTGVAGDVITMQRAQEGTTAKAWATGDIFALLITAGTMAAMTQQERAYALEYGGNATGTVDALSITTGQPLSTLTAGQVFSFTAAGVNTVVGPTLSVNGFTSAQIGLAGGGLIPAGFLQTGRTYLVQYDGTVFRILSFGSFATSFTIIGPSAVDRATRFQTNALMRALCGVNSTAESGANAGSDFQLALYDDAGNILSIPWVVTRATGVQNFAISPTVPNLSFGDSSFKAVNSAFVQAAVQPFPSGTRMSFNQTSAPTGWTKDTSGSLNDSIMRIVTGSASSGGANGFTAFNSQTATAGYTLAIADIPAHHHDIIISGSSNNAGPPNNATCANTAGATFASNDTGGGGAHAHGMTTSIKYNDFIIAQKN